MLSGATGWSVSTAWKHHVFSQVPLPLYGIQLHSEICSQGVLSCCCNCWGQRLQLKWGWQWRSTYWTVVACVTVFVECLNCTSTIKLQKELLSSTSNVLFGASMILKHLKDIETIHLSKQRGLFLSMTEKSRRSIAAMVTACNVIKYVFIWPMAFCIASSCTMGGLVPQKWTFI